MNAIARKIFVPVAALLASGGVALAAVPAGFDTNLGLAGNTPGSDYTLDSAGGLTLYSSLTSSASFVSGLSQDLSLSGASVTNFETNLSSFLGISPASWSSFNGLAGAGNLGTSTTDSWFVNVAFDASGNTATYSSGTNTGGTTVTTGGGSVAVPGPVAGSGIFGLLAALGFVGFAWRKRAATGSLGL